MRSSAVHLSLIVLAYLSASCSEDARPRGHYAPNTTQAADTTFLRFHDDGGGEGVMETAIATYEGERGEKVELISAVHIADPVYYARLEKLFRGYDSLLYELVKHKDSLPPEKGRTSRGDSSNLVSWFQRYMRDTLELEFQLDAIDYRAPNFVHADLDAETFLKLSDERGEGLVKLMLMMALKELQRQRTGGSEVDPNMGFKMLAAFFMPDSARILKYLLAQQLQHAEEIMAGLGEGPDGKGSVILIERNKALMRVLHARLEKGDRKIGVFYGGAHLSDIEKRIFAEIGLRRTGIRWEAAWTIRRAKSEK